MKAIGIVGASDTGKTTLIERLIPALDGSVAAIKSIHHDIEIDQEGKDTYRHRVAGAEKVVGITPSFTFAIENKGKKDFDNEASLYQLLDRLADEGFAYTLVEGFTTSSLPKLVVGNDSGDEIEGRIRLRIPDASTVAIDQIIDEINQIDNWEIRDDR